MISSDDTSAGLPALSIRDLVVEFDTADGSLRAVDGVSFDLRANETLAIVGESGSGKSVTMLAAMGLLAGTGRVVSGSIELAGRDMLTMTGSERRRILGKEISMIFQDPMTSMNPVMRIGAQIAEMIRLHAGKIGKAAVRDRVVELLEMVRIPNASACVSRYPHELSGGMRQRVMIAMAVAHSPSVLIADEPTTALDVTIQAQVLRVLAGIRRELGGSMALITHDLGLVAEYADRVVVMYGGRIMETGTVQQIFSDPRHPYTAGLLASSIRLDGPVDVTYAIPGQPPTLAARPTGCVFHPRCEMRKERDECATSVPELTPTAVVGNRAACHFSSETSGWAEVLDRRLGIPHRTGTPS